MTIMRDEVINDITKWIDECIYFSRKINTNIVAHKSGYSLRHIHNIFKNEVGITVGHYIRLRRITCAALLLKFTNKSIFDIAIDMNYGSQQAFCRTFHNTFKCKPLEYRKRKYINTSELYPPYPGKISHLNFGEEERSINLITQEVKYREAIIGNYNKKSQSNIYAKIINLLDHNYLAYIASDFIKLNNPESTVGIISHIGLQINNNSSRTFKIRKKRYASVNFEGSWSEYLTFKRSLYVKSNFTRMDGYDIEIFSLLPCDLGTASNLRVKILVPI
ncbi:TPA: helix-turn-helix domain-containing protein [Klebsiella oxytoca]